MRVRGALLGAGNIALRGHAPQWAEDPDLREAVDIVAVADLSADNLEAARRQFPRARLYGDALELLDREELDFCDICSPPFTHRTLVEAAVEQGLHVICEKPLAPTLADAEAIDEAVRKAGVVFQPCHQYHYSPQWQAVRAWLPRLGRIYLAEHEVHRMGANAGSANWSPEWRTDPRLAGGGILFDHGAHIFYQLRAALGEPASVQAVTRTLCHTGYDVEDSAYVVLEFPGCLAQVRLTWAARHRAICFRFVGEAGEIVGDDVSARLEAEAREEVRFDEGLSRDSAHSGWYAPLFRDFVRRIQAADRSSAGLEEAVYVTRVIARAYESSREGRALPLVAAPSRPAAGELHPVPVAGPASYDGEAAPERGPSLSFYRRWGLRIAALAALGAASAWTFHDIQWGELRAALGAAQLAWIGLAALVNFAVLYAQAGRWYALVRPLSSLVSLAETFRALIMGFAVSTVVPARAGELARVEWLGRRANLPRLAVLSSVVLDHLVNALGLLAAVALLPLFVEVPLWVRPGAWFALALFAVAAVGVFVLRPRVGEPRDLLRVGAEALANSGVRRFLAQARAGLLAVRRPRALGFSISASLVSWVLEVQVTTLSFRAVGLRLPLAASILVLLAVNLALAFPLAPPANMGTLELGATLALVQFGVDKEQALAFALVYHFLQVLPIGIAGLFFASQAAAQDRRNVRVAA